MPEPLSVPPVAGRAHRAGRHGRRGASGWRLLLFGVLAVGLAGLAGGGQGGVGAAGLGRQAVPAGYEAVPAGYEAVLPGSRAAVAAETAGRVSRYAIAARVDVPTGTVAGEARVAFRNATGVALGEVFFRLFPNADYYGDGGLTVGRLAVEGRETPAGELAGLLSVGGTVLRVPLAGPLAPGGTAAIVVGFATAVPADSTGSFGILSRSSETGTWALADWYPSLAGWEPGAGWRLDAPTDAGDPTFGDVALYEVALTGPAGLAAVTSGSPVGEEALPGGETTRRFVAGPARDFSLTLDADYAATAAAAGGTTVTAHANPGGEAGAAAAVGVAAEALAVYGELFGPYPFAELDLVDAPLAPGVLGVSWAGLIFLDTESLAGSADDPRFLAFLLAHEVGHQWWGGSVGMNSNDHPFLLEGLTNYLMVVYVERTAGAAAAEAMLRGAVAAPYLALLREGEDQVADLAVADGGGQEDRGPILYGKAALGFLAIRRAVGDAAFFEALAAVAEAYGFRIAEPGDVLAAFEAASGRELDAVWGAWFEAAGTTAAEVEALLDG